MNKRIFSLMATIFVVAGIAGVAIWYYGSRPSKEEPAISSETGNPASTDYQSYCFDASQGRFMIADSGGKIISQGKLQELEGLQGKILNGVRDGVLVNGIHADIPNHRILIAVQKNQWNDQSGSNEFQIVTLGTPFLNVVGISEPMDEVPSEFKLPANDGLLNLPSDLNTFIMQWIRTSSSTILLYAKPLNQARARFFLYEQGFDKGDVEYGTGLFALYDSSRFEKIKKFQISEVVGILPHFIGIAPDENAIYFAVGGGQEKIFVINLTTFKATRLTPTGGFYGTQCVFFPKGND